jgi:hypothetical protein
MSGPFIHPKAKPTASETSTYEVGYRKPPEATRFKPGQSGNPRGRRKRPESDVPLPHEQRLKRIILEEAYRPIAIQHGNRTVRMPMVQTVMRSIGLTAARGHHKSQRMFVDLLKMVEGEMKAEHYALLEQAIEYKADWEIELDMRKRFGTTGPQPLPHPDDIVIDRSTGEVTFKGPVTTEEKATWDKMRRRKADAKKEIAAIKKLLKKDPDNVLHLKLLSFEQRVHDTIAKMIPDEEDP